MLQNNPVIWCKEKWIWIDCWQKSTEEVKLSWGTILRYCLKLWPMLHKDQPLWRREQKMAPVSAHSGYWGPPTATMDWCEQNYEVILTESQTCWERRFCNYCQTWYFILLQMKIVSPHQPILNDINLQWFCCAVSHWTPRSPGMWLSFGTLSQI